MWVYRKISIPALPQSILFSEMLEVVLTFAN